MDDLQSKLAKDSDFSQKPLVIAFFFAAKTKRMCIFKIQNKSTTHTNKQNIYN